MILLLILRHAHGVAAHASIESLPFLLIVDVDSLCSSRLLNIRLHPSPLNLDNAMC